MQIKRSLLQSEKLIIQLVLKRVFSSHKTVTEGVIHFRQLAVCSGRARGQRDALQSAFYIPNAKESGGESFLTQLRRSLFIPISSSQHTHSTSGTRARTEQLLKPAWQLPALHCATCTLSIGICIPMSSSEIKTISKEKYYD